MAWVQHDFVIRDFYLLTATEKISRNGHFNDLSNEFKIIQLVNYICSEKNFQWEKGFLMVHTVWRWGNSFRPCYGVAKSVKLRCNLPWRHSHKTRLKTALWTAFACVASVLVRAERNLCIQDARKMGREQKGRPPWSFLLSPDFPHVLNAKIPSRGPIFRSARTGTLDTQARTAFTNAIIINVDSRKYTIQKNDFYFISQCPWLLQ